MTEPHQVCHQYVAATVLFWSVLNVTSNATRRISVAERFAHHTINSSDLVIFHWFKYVTLLNSFLSGCFYDQKFVQGILISLWDLMGRF